MFKIVSHCSTWFPVDTRETTCILSETPALLQTCKHTLMCRDFPFKYRHLEWLLCSDWLRTFNDLARCLSLQTEDRPRDRHGVLAHQESSSQGRVQAASLLLPGPSSTRHGGPKIPPSQAQRVQSSCSLARLWPRLLPQRGIPEAEETRKRFP